MPRKRAPKRHTVTVTGISHEGRGICHIDGKTTFVFNALPGETVEIQLDKTRGSFNEAHSIRIIEPSAERQTPPCEYFGQCGGCALQHMPHTMQIQQKENALKELLQQQGNAIAQQWLPPLTADTSGYRRKARLSVKYVPGKSKVLVGFRERNGRYVMNMNYCQILHPSVGKIIDKLSDLIINLSIKEHIPQIEVAIGDDITTLNFRHLQPLSPDDLNKLASFAQEHGIHVYLQPSKADSIHPLAPPTPPRLSYSLPDYGITFEFKPEQFTQINASINKKMINQALELLELKPKDNVLDLFCGIGNFSLPIAQQVQSVTGVEGDPSAISQAQHNAKLNNIHNTDFFCANLFETDYNNTSWAQQEFNKVVLDPPRAGAKEIISQLKQWLPERIVYISCNPATLARDASLIIEHGYTLASAGVMDMFPHTAHIEAINLFIRTDLCSIKKSPLTT